MRLISGASSTVAAFGVFVIGIRVILPFVIFDGGAGVRPDRGDNDAVRRASSRRCGHGTRDGPGSPGRSPVPVP
ncbi:hypothetical protein GCM10015536_44210 [Streptomyces griseomycini]|nr:hypothetical protein GCM10015536_44210 [Streptomyces griseomycini]